MIVQYVRNHAYGFACILICLIFHLIIHAVQQGIIFIGITI